MATTTKNTNIETCRSCGHKYKTPERPKCLGEECKGQREYLDSEGTLKIMSGFCIFCCFQNFRKASPKRERLLIKGVGYLCYYCGKTKLAICSCCEESILCEPCCGEAFNHKLCCKTKQIEFTNQGLAFAYPANMTIIQDGKGWANRDAALQILNKTYPLTFLDPKGFTINNSRRFASVEIEIFDYNNATKLNKVLDSWSCSVVRDASMVREANRRGLIVSRDKTFEINTSPACGNALYNELKDITEALAAAEARVTIDCGIHVHVDCRDYGYQDIRKLIKIYYYIEDALFAAVHWTRQTNDFCKPCGEEYYQKVIASHIKPTTADLKKAIITSVYGDKSLDTGTNVFGDNRRPNFWHERADHYGRNGGLQRNEKRYSAINLHSYFLRGSVEDRIHHGSTDFNEIYGWAKILIDIFDSIIALADNKLDKMLEISPYEINSARELIRGDAITRKLDINKVSIGVALLQYLLPQDTFNMLLTKIMVNCHDAVISTTKVLPCQLGKAEEQPEVLIDPVGPPDLQNIFGGNLDAQIIEALNMRRRNRQQRGR